jgi:hypothetical protein
MRTRRVRSLRRPARVTPGAYAHGRRRTVPARRSGLCGTSWLPRTLRLGAYHAQACAGRMSWPRPSQRFVMDEPGLTADISNTPEYGIAAAPPLDDEDASCAHRRTQHADALPSVLAAGIVPTAAALGATLPPNPKAWTPAQPGASLTLRSARAASSALAFRRRHGARRSHHTSRARLRLSFATRTSPGARSFPSMRTTFRSTLCTSLHVAYEAPADASRGVGVNKL